MPNFFDYSPVKKALAAAKSIPVVLPQKPSKDKVAAALGLFLSLKKMGRETSVVCSEEMTVELSWLVGVDRIGKEMGGKNLVIAFDYIEDSIEKVSYNIEGGKFNLVVQPKEGFNPLSTDKVEYSYGGGQADLVFAIGSPTLDSLGEIYQQNREFFKEEKVVNLDHSPGNTQFGKYNLVNTKASSCSELVAGLLSRLGLPVDADIASNLFYGLEVSTQSFSLSSIGPGTFEAAAFCLRAGARKRGFHYSREVRKKKPPLRPMPAAVSASRSPDSVEKSPLKDFGEKTGEKPSSDWFEPKIYQGNTRI